MDVSQLRLGAVVVAIQDDHDMDRALRWGAREAVLHARPLVTLHVDRHDSAALHRWYSPADEAARLARSSFPGLEVEAMTLVGSAQRLLVEASGRAHLLVLGSRGRGIFRSILQGSVSSAVTSRARGPVIVVRPGPDAGPDGRVVVGADATPESREAIEFAFRYASLHDRPLLVMHCFWDASYVAARVLAGPKPDVEDLQLLLSESIAGFRERFPDVDVSTELSPGLVDRCLTLDPEGRHLLVVGQPPLNAVVRLMTGSTATAVLQSAHTAVAVIPSADDNPTTGEQR